MYMIISNLELLRIRSINDNEQTNEIKVTGRDIRLCIHMTLWVLKDGITYRYFKNTHTKISFIKYSSVTYVQLLVWKSKW